MNPFQKTFFTGYRATLVLLMVVFTPCLLFSQSLNIGFDNGTFSGWNGFTGQCCPVYAPFNGIVPQQHAITSGSSADPFSGGLIPVVFPGSLHSAKLGNVNNSAESEILQTAFVVPADSLFLLIHYATVLENGMHPEAKQSRFTWAVTSSGAQPQGCSSEEIYAGDTLSGMLYNGAVELIPWQTRVLNLTGLAGDTITMTFTTGDCGPGGHFGYAYIDSEIIPVDQVINGCNPDGSMDITLNNNLNPLWFNGSTGNSVNITDPVINGGYYALFNQGTGCEFQLDINPAAFLPNASFTYNTGCSGEIAFYNNSIADPQSVYNWHFGDGDSSSNITPVHIYNPGNYTVTQYVVQPNNCLSEHSVNLIIDEPLEGIIIVSDSCIFEDITLAFIQSKGAEIITTNWHVDGIFVTSGPTAVLNYTNEGNHIVLLITEDIYGCTDTIVSVFTVTYSPDCGEGNITFYIPNAFTPNNDGINDLIQTGGVDTDDILSFEIYNRYGQLVSTDINWNGRYNGEPCQEGVYTYKCVYITGSRKNIKTGTLTLIR